MKNGQLVENFFAFCPVKDDVWVKKIQDPVGLPTNMTLLSAFFKILSNKGRNLFGEQKVYKNNKEVKDQVQDPIIYFAFAFATYVESEELLTRVGHDWHNRSGDILKVKGLQAFESKTILCFFHVFTTTPKNMVLSEFCDILSKA